MAQTILDRIVETKRKEVAAARAAVPIEAVQAAAAAAPPVRNLFTACTRAPARSVNVIAEIKRASPSAGDIRADADPAAIAARYTAAGAAGISVLTDREYFGGSLDDLRAVRAAVDVPVLRKDFIIDPYQVYEARAAGADAILLIAECLPGGPLMDLLILAASVKLTCLIEVHSMESLLRVRSLANFPHAAYNLLGINNRDLRTFEVDIAQTLRLAELVDEPHRLVSESGIKTADDVRRLSATGVRTVLIGETLMRADDTAAAFEDLFGPRR